MGMYTEMYLAVRFNEDTPEEIIKTIERLANPPYVGKDDSEESWKLWREYCVSTDWPDHPFFKTDRFRSCFYGNSYYFDAQPMNKFVYDEIAESWFLTLVANIKNYDQEWQKFLDWIGPHIHGNQHIGHIRYEEFDLPTLLYAKKGEVKEIHVPEPDWLG